MIRDSHEVPTRPLAAVLAFMCSGCDYEVYSTQAGEHVVYHWDVDARAAEGEQLCGGTVRAADRFVAGIANYYGWTLGENGPTIEVFWDNELAKHACTWLRTPACVIAVLGLDVFLYQPFDSHELAHTANGGHGHSPFIDETFAWRWSSGVIAGEFTLYTLPNFPSANQLRSQFQKNPFDVDVWSGFTWWVALESTYGPAKMAEFIAELDSSPYDVERALERSFGISLAESAALAEALPEVSVNDPVCEFDGLPRLVWNGEPLVIDRSGARCEDDDIIAITGSRASWLVELEFPEIPVDVDVRVTVSDGDVTQREFVMATCNGELTYDPISYDPLSAELPDKLGVSRSLGGRYVASLIGVVKADGSVAFPRVVIEEQKQP